MKILPHIEVFDLEKQLLRSLKNQFLVVWPRDFVSNEVMEISEYFVYFGIFITHSWDKNSVQSPKREFSEPPYELVNNSNAHGAAGACNHAHSSFDGGSGEVGHLSLSNLADLSAGDGSDLGLVGDTGALVLTDGLQNEGRGRRGLGDEREAAIGINGDHDRDLEAGLILGAIVEFSDELCNVNAVLAESRTYRGRCSRFRGRDLKLDITSNFLCHY